MAKGKGSETKNPYDPRLMGRFHRLVTDPDPVLSAVIMGHLLVEEQIWQVVREAIPNPSALDEARLSFAQLTAVAEAVVDDSKLKRCWHFVRRLNTIRNRYAHQVEPEKVRAELGAFIGDICAEKTPGASEEKPPVCAENVTTAIRLLWLWIDPSPTFGSKEIEDDPMWK